MTEQPSGWMPGVFRELLHWITPHAHAMTHNFGTTYYAECGAPCLYFPGTRSTYADWSGCPDCILLHDDRPEWSTLAWGHSPLEHNIAHARTTPAVPRSPDQPADWPTDPAHPTSPAPQPFPEHGTSALCGAWLVSPSPDPRRVAGVHACGHCVLILTDNAP